MNEMYEISVQRFIEKTAEPLKAIVAVHCDNGSVFVIRAKRIDGMYHRWEPDPPFQNASQESILWRRIVRALENAYEAHQKNYDFSFESMTNEWWLDELEGSSDWRQQELF